MAIKMYVHGLSFSVFFLFCFLFVSANLVSAKIPSMNDSSLDLLRPGSLVQFRCMVQDTFDPEFYLDVYEEVAADGTKVCDDVLVCSCCMYV